MEARTYSLNVEVRDDDLIDMDIMDDVGQSSLVSLTPMHALEVAGKLFTAVMEIAKEYQRRAEQSGGDTP
jgi:hypothetical protein